MMYHKALFFKDSETAKQILASSNPRDQKDLGRKVRGFDEKAWEGVAPTIVHVGNMLKFTQNPTLLKSLLATAGTTLVEASPYDTIWGIGLSEDDPAAKRRETWRGKNRLGQILTSVRDYLITLEDTI